MSMIIPPHIKSYLIRLSSILTVSIVLNACGEISYDIKKEDEIKSKTSNNTSTNNTSNLSECSNNSLTSGDCYVSGSGKMVTTNFGNTINTWSNSSATTTIEGFIVDGYYTGKSCNFSDADLLANNIKQGVNLFGVNGSLVEAFSNCTDNALNANQCSTAVNRYVYSSQYGGRSANCLTGLNSTACWTNATNRYVTSTLGSNVNGVNGGLSVVIPSGYYSGSTTATMSDLNLTPGNIKSGTTIFGITGIHNNIGGSFSENFASTAPRNPGGSFTIPTYILGVNSTQISLINETQIYAGADLPAGYRDIPNATIDDDGYQGVSCRYANHPSVVCGTTHITLQDRINDCAAKNPGSSSWDGALMCNGSHGEWSLVTHVGYGREVWKDMRTGLLWSSKLPGTYNWCKASGNTSKSSLNFVNSYHGAPPAPIIGNGTISNISSANDLAATSATITIQFTSATTFTVSGGDCSGGNITGGLTTSAGSSVTYTKNSSCSFTITQGSINFQNSDFITLKSATTSSSSCKPGGSLQDTNPAVSACAEQAGLNPAASENWTTPAYSEFKGGMGAVATSSSPSVKWRLPSLTDYQIAVANGLMFVMPDMGLSDTDRPNKSANPPAPYPGGSTEWTSTSYSTNKNNAWTVFGHVQNFEPKSTFKNVRCVGR